MVEARVDTPSSDYAAMEPYWRMVDDIMGGTPTMRAAGERYLPKFGNESPDAYEYRRKTAKFVNIFRDIMENLAAKPFSREVSLIEKSSSPAILELAEDIDGSGNNLHTFGQELFFRGIVDAISWVLVDFPAVEPGLTVADEKAVGARPYWVHVPARDLLAVRTASIGGKEQIVHARILETAVLRDGFGEKTVRRVRVLDREQVDGGAYQPATFTVYEEQEGPGQRSKTWVPVEEGRISIGVIPLVPFLAGRRVGGSWRVIPPMQDAAHLQVEHYQAESNLKAIKDQCAFPMLSASGVSPVTDASGAPAPISIGPRSVLYAPANGDGKAGTWSFVEPQANSLTFLAKDIERIEQQLRELGRQPLTAQTGNLTVISTAFAASKANSVISAWALNLKDALEQAFVLTALWLRDASEPEVDVETEFDALTDEQVGPDALLRMRERNDLSQATLWAEFKRRGLLSPDFVADRERERLLEELPGADDLENMTAAIAVRGN